MKLFNFLLFLLVDSCISRSILRFSLKVMPAYIFDLSIGSCSSPSDTLHIPKSTLLLSIRNDTAVLLVEL